MFNIWIFIIKTFSLKLITLNLTSGTVLTIFQNFKVFQKTGREKILEHNVGSFTILCQK